MAQFAVDLLVIRVFVRMEDHSVTIIIVDHVILHVRLVRFAATANVNAPLVCSEMPIIAAAVESNALLIKFVEQMVNASAPLEP